MPLAKCSFGMIPLSCHAVDRSPRVLHYSTHNVVRTSCFDVLIMLLLRQESGFASSRWTFRQWPAILSVHHFEKHFVQCWAVIQRSSANREPAAFRRQRLIFTIS